MAFPAPALAALLALVALGFVWPQNAIAGAALRSFVSGAGYALSYDALNAGLSEATATNVRVTTKTGDAVFGADKIDVHYSLRDLLPGGRHRFGLTAVDIARPRVTLIHYPDGQYNVKPPAGGAPQKPDTTPIDLRVRVRNGSVALLDRYTIPGNEQRERLVDVSADVALSPVTHSFYNVTADLIDNGRRFPLSGHARFDARRGLEDQRWGAGLLPAGPLVNFGLSTHAIRIVSGSLHDVGLRIATFVDPDGTTHPHIGGSARLADGKIFVAQLTTPVRNARGVLRVYDDGVTTTGIDATLAGVPLHAAGGVYGLAAPRLQFAATARGTLEELRSVTAAAQRYPVSGPVSIAARITGPLQTPLVVADIDAPAVRYNTYRFDGVRATLGVRERTLDVLAARVRYGPVRVNASGTVQLEGRMPSDIVATVSGDGNRLPYVGHVLRDLQLSGLVHLSGPAGRLASNGIAYGNARDGRFDALFNFDPDGRGTVGPIVLDRDDGASIYGRVAIDRPEQQVTAVLAARDLTLLPAVPQQLPGLTLPDVATIPGRLDADVAGTVDHAVLTGAAGRLHAGNVRLGKLAATIDATAETTGPAQIGARLTAATTAGDLTGRAAADDGVIAFDGRFRSSFGQLRPFVGDVGGRGGFDAHLSGVFDRGDVVGQIGSVAFDRASLHGIALRGGAGTVVRHRDGTIDVPSLRVDAADGRVLASGSIGGRRPLAAVASLDLAALRPAAGVRGTAVAYASVNGTLAAPHADVGVAVAGGSVRGIPFMADGNATYGGDALRVHDAEVVALGGFATASGTIADVRRAPRLALDASLRDFDVATLAHVAKLPLRYPEGTLEGDVRASGPATAAQLAGDARIPEGSINGLRFNAAHVAFAGSRSGVTIADGGVAVGSTRVALTGSASQTHQTLHLRAPYTDLSDFNGYFDTADTFAGRGALAVDLGLAPDALSTGGTVTFARMRFRRFALGDVGARWSTRGRTIAFRANVRGTHGNAATTVSATMPAVRPLRDPMHRAQVVADATLDGLDLATWLPAAGIQQPVLGIVAGRAHVSGAPAAPAFSADASLANGLVGPYHVDSAALALRGNSRRVQIDRAHAAGPGLSADLSGSAGYRSADPVAIALHAESPAIDALVRATGRQLDVAGSGAIDARLAGTRGAPQLAATLDAANLRVASLAIPRVHAEAAADRSHVALANTEADFARGRVMLDASAPISLTAPTKGLRDAPLAATLRADALDLRDVASVLPKGTTLTGRVDGTIRASGTATAPVLEGGMTLADGSYASSMVRSPLTDIRATLALAGSDIRLTDLHATAGGGSLDGSGSAHVGDLRDFAHRVAFDASITARKARFDLNPYGRGVIDGTVRATQQAGRVASVSGDITASQTRIALTAILPKGGGGATPAPLPPVGLNLNVTAANDVRVQSGNVDIGARGQVAVGGTLRKPALSGSIHSTDGTLSFYRTFVLQRGVVAFDPADGIIPNVDATATTRVDDPPTDILLQVRGPATQLDLQLASNPSYDRQQILGLLVNAQALGAVSGIAQTEGGTGGNFSVANLGGSFLSQQFTRTLLQPLGSQIGNALGFENLALGYDYGNGFSAGATRTIGKNLTASFSESFGADRRSSLALRRSFGPATAMQLTVYSSSATTLSALSSTQSLFAPAGPVNYTLEAAEPPSGSSGYVVTYQRRFW